MNALSLLAAFLALSFTLTTGDAEAAKRVGSGTSSGMQRQATTPPQAAAPAAKTEARQKLSRKPGTWSSHATAVPAGWLLESSNSNV